MSKKGYIKLHRSIQDNELWDDPEPFDRRSAWIDLLLMANHKDIEVYYDGKTLTVKRGDMLTSLRKLAVRWGWGKDKVERFMCFLESRHMLTRKRATQRATAGTLITIVNYDIYQGFDGTNETTSETRTMTTTATRTDRNNNDIKNIKNDIYTCSFEHAWEIYPRKDEKKRAYECYTARLNSGYSEEELLQATEAYAKECEERQTEKRYIKQAKTFFGINEPFVDYLKRAKAQEKKQDLSSFFDINEANNTPPYFGLPKEWFDGDTLIESRVEPIWHPRMHGLPEGTESAKEVINTFNWRKRGWHEYNKRKGESSGSE